MVQEVFVVANACPLCKGDVKGNDDALYYCDKCNILFARHSLLDDSDNGDGSPDEQEPLQPVESEE